MIAWCFVIEVVRLYILYRVGGLLIVLGECIFFRSTVCVVFLLEIFWRAE